MERTLETSSQVAVRLAVVLVFGLVALAAELGLDILLGGFVAGHDHAAGAAQARGRVLESKLTAVGYGLLILFFFITSGMEFDLDALTSSTEAALKMVMFVGLFLVVRGIPARCSIAASSRDARSRRARLLLLDRAAARGRHYRDRGRPGPLKSSTAAGLVGAAIISTLVFPLVAMRLRLGARAEPAAAAA